jgi:hypothetical protein
MRFGAAITDPPTVGGLEGDIALLARNGSSIDLPLRTASSRNRCDRVARCA